MKAEPSANSDKRNMKRFGTSPLEPRDHHYHHGRQSNVSRCAKVLLYVCLLVLLVTCVSMALVIKGAQHANHELQQQLVAEQQRYNRLKQSIAEEKVVIVDAEQRTKEVERSLTMCELELKLKTEEVEEAEEDHRALDIVVDDLKKQLQASTDRISRGVGVIDGLIADAMTR